MNQETNTLARRWFAEVWNQRKRETIFSLVDPACAGHHEGEETTGPEDLAAMHDRLVGLLPDLKTIVEDVVADGDDAVVRWRFTGTHTGTVGPLKPTGRAVKVCGMTWLKFRDGRIVEGWDHWNQAAFLQQIQAPV